MPTPGYDVFFPDPGVYDQMTCRVCETICRVTRSRLGPTSFSEAVMRKERPHDVFVCPHADEEWHNVGRKLLSQVNSESDSLLVKAFRYRFRRWQAAHCPPDADM